jgi:hypothetical protein
VKKGILELALSGSVPLQLDYREPSTGKNAENRRPPSANERRLSIPEKIQIADVFAWLLHAIEVPGELK